MVVSRLKMDHEFVKPARGRGLRLHRQATSTGQWQTATTVPYVLTPQAVVTVLGNGLMDGTFGVIRFLTISTDRDITVSVGGGGSVTIQAEGHYIVDGAVVNALVLSNPSETDTATVRLRLAGDVAGPPLVWLRTTLYTVEFNPALWARTTLYTDELELPVWLRTTLYTEEFLPEWARTTLYTDELELPVWARTTLYTEEFATWVRTPLYTDELEPSAWVRTPLYTEEFATWVRTPLYTDELEPQAWARTTLYTDDLELPTWARTTLYTDDFSGWVRTPLYTDDLDPQAWVRTTLYTDDLELPVWARTTLYTDELEPVGFGRRLSFIADDLDAALNDGELVDSWTDNEIGVIVTASGTARPTFVANAANGHAGVRFAGGQGLSVASPLTDIVAVNGITVFIVAANLTATTFGAFIATDSPSPRDFNIFMSSRTGNSVEFYSESSSYHRQSTGSIVPGRTLITCVCDVAAGTQDIYLDGVLANTGSVTIPAAVTMNGPTLRIGRDGFGDFLIGDISEIELYEQAIPAAARATKESELMTKYGIPPVWSRTNLYTDELEPDAPGGVINGLRFFFLADDLAAGASPLTDSDPVVDWTDNTGNVTLSALSGQEAEFKENILNGHAAVRFDGLQGVEGTNVLSDMVGATGFTVFAVIANSDPVGGNYRSIVATDSSSNRDFILHTGINGTEVWLDSQDQTTRTQGASNISGSNGFVLSGLYDATGPTQDVYVNGTLDTNSVSSIPASVTMDGIKLYIGKAGHANRYISADILAVAFYDRALSSSEQQAVELDFMTFFDIT